MNLFHPILDHLKQIMKTRNKKDHQLKQIQHMVDEGFLKQPNMDALQVESDPEKLADWMMAYEPEKMEKKWIYVG